MPLFDTKLDFLEKIEEEELPVKDVIEIEEEHNINYKDTV